MKFNLYKFLEIADPKLRKQTERYEREIDNKIFLSNISEKYIKLSAKSYKISQLYWGRTLRYRVGDCPYIANHNESGPKPRTSLDELLFDNPNVAEAIIKTNSYNANKVGKTVKDFICLPIKVFLDSKDKNKGFVIGYLKKDYINRANFSRTSLKDLYADPSKFQSNKIYSYPYGEVMKEVENTYNPENYTNCRLF